MNRMTVAQQRLTRLMHNDAAYLNMYVTVRDLPGFEVSGDKLALNGWTARPAPDVLTDSRIIQKESVPS